MFRALSALIGCFVWPVLGLILGLCLWGCTPPAVEPVDGCNESSPVYHRATLSHDRCPVTYADVEAEYAHALEGLGGCPSYLFRDEWCPALDVPEAAPESAAWTASSFSHVETCRDLYWSRGAYCHALEEGRYP